MCSFCSYSFSLSLIPSSLNYNIFAYLNLFGVDFGGSGGRSRGGGGGGVEHWGVINNIIKFI